MCPEAKRFLAQVTDNTSVIDMALIQRGTRPTHFDAAMVLFGCRHGTERKRFVFEIRNSKLEIRLRLPLHEFRVPNFDFRK